MPISTHIDEINKIIDSISSWNSNDHFVKGSLDFFKILISVDENVLYNDEEFFNCCLKNFENIFYNDFVIQNIKIHTASKSYIDFESAVTLKLAVEVGFFPLSFCAKTIDKRFAGLMLKTIDDVVLNLNNSIEKKIQTHELLYLLDSIVSEKKYLYKLNTFVDDFKKFSNYRIIASNIIKLISINQSSAKLLEDEFKNIVSNHEKMEHFSLWTALSIIYAQVEKRKQKIDGILNSRHGDLKLFYLHFEDKNISTAFFIIETFLKGFKLSGKIGSIKDETETNLKNFITTSSEVKKLIYNHSKTHFRAYGGQFGDKGLEWSNKIFLITNKTLSTFEVLTDAKDKQWIFDVAVFEIYRWINDIHIILNKYELEDDWSEIKDYLIEENNKVEWKSTFLTPTESLYQNDDKETNIGATLLRLISQTILGMLNTEGGVILVGVIESPEKIKRDDIKKMLIKKNGVTFFDINYEFKKKNITNNDVLKRKIQDNLCTETRCGVEHFNNLWTIQPIEIKNNYKSVYIYKIEVHKSQNLIFSSKDNWVTLIKRADARTVEVSPKNLFSLTKNEL